MRILRTVAEVRQELEPHHRTGERIGLVLTMGAFHAGHESLIARARMENRLVAVSLFVNPTQFDDPRDLGAYPREEEHDARRAKQLGADVLFAPEISEIYPRGFASKVSVGGVSEPLEGLARGRSHFDGVATVVTKLLNIVRPHAAYFGQKDAQQVAVIKRLVADLELPVEIRVCGTVREPDGLAMSSRNVHLSADQRRRAPALRQALLAVERALQDGERDPGRALQAGHEVLTAASLEPEYLELVDLTSMEPVGPDGLECEVLAVIAARLGSTRLIDNHLIQPLPVSASRVSGAHSVSASSTDPGRS